MRLGLNLPNNQGVARIDDLVALAVDAERAGFDSVWVSEHLFHASYVEQRLNGAPYHEALTVLTAVAGATQRVRLGTSVLVLPWHHPVRLAKTVASLDTWSNGRVTLGVGVGNAADEYAALGVDFARRGRIADEMLAAMQALWTQDPPAFAGEWFRFSGLRFAPKPQQRPHVPLWIGGNTAPALRRAARFGQGWQPLGISPNELRGGIERLQQLRNAAGTQAAQDPHAARAFDVAPRVTVSITTEPWDRPVADRRTARGTPDELRAMLRAYAEAGATEIILDANTPDLGAVRAMLSLFAPAQVAPG